MISIRLPARHERQPERAAIQAGQGVPGPRASEQATDRARRGRGPADWSRPAAERRS